MVVIATKPPATGDDKAAVDAQWSPVLSLRGPASCQLPAQRHRAYATTTVLGDSTVLLLLLLLLLRVEVQGSKERQSANKKKHGHIRRPNDTRAER